MNGRLYRKLLTLVASLVVIVIPLAYLPQAPLYDAHTVPLPLYADVSVSLPVVNAGPTAPLVVEPGGCVLMVLSDEYANVTVSGGYIWRVEYSNEGAVLFNYTIVTRKQGKEVEVCVPQTTEKGVYDIILYGSRELSVPRGLWVVDRPKEKLRIAVVSDLHFGVVGSTDLWRFSAGFIVNTLNPDIVIWSGDIQDVDTAHYARLAQAYRYMMYYEYPVFSVPGNHDRPGLHYSTYLGPTRWARSISGELLIVGFYTDTGIQPGNVLTWDEIAFVEEALSNYSHVPHKILVTHYPMFYCRDPCVVRASYDDEEVLKPFERGVVTPVSSYWSVNMTAFRYMLKLIEDYNVTAVISGHIHRDQYILYISTRTNTITHFITVTSSGQTTPTYPGVRVFELDLETGELKLIEHPNVGTNSIPIEHESHGLHVRAARGPEAYRITLLNRLPWFTVSFRSVIPIPWASETPPKVEIRELTGAARAQIQPVHVFGSFAYLGFELYVPPESQATIVLYRAGDREPPSLALTRWIPDVPRLNRTLTIYLSTVDESWGINPWSLQIFLNCTPQPATTVSPGTYYAMFNRVSIELRFTPVSRESLVCRLDIRIADNADRETTKSYIITVYPPGVTPQEPPVREIDNVEAPIPPVEETQTTPISETQISPETTPMIEESPSPSLPYTHTPVTEQTLEQTWRGAEMIQVAIIVLGAIAMAIVLFIIRSRVGRAK